MQSPDAASCRNFHWIFELCVRNHIDTRRILRNVNHPIETLEDPSQFIDWKSFITLFSNLGNYFTDEQLFEAAIGSWKHPGLRPYTVIGRLLNTVKDQYFSMFGPFGVATRLFPIDISMLEPEPGHLQLKLTMRDGLTSSRPFQVAIAGQLAGLPSAMGEPEAEVTVQHMTGGATIDVWFENRPGIFSMVRKALLWPFTARESARQLTRAYDSLLEQYREVREESIKLKEAEKRALESEARYQLLERNVNDVIWIMDMDMTFQYVSASVDSLLGYRPEEIVDKGLFDLLSETSRARVAELVRPERLMAADDGPSTNEVEMVRKDGSLTWIEVRSSIVRDEHHRPINLVGVSRDISERKAFEQDLKEREEAYRAISTTAQDAIVTVNETNIITFANPAATRIFGHQQNQLIGRPLHELMPKAHHGTLLDIKNSENPPASLILEGRSRDRERLTLEATFALHRRRDKDFVTWIIRDITTRSRIEEERKALEQQLHAAQRMESIGQLTGGIAHDFNNLLVAINGYAELAQGENLSAEKLRQYLGEIQRAGERAADMTHKLLAFSRRQIIEPKLISVNKLINGIERIIDRLLPENIAVKFVPDLRNPNIIADAGQIEQVIVNLAVNARDAMPGGGKLMISVENRRINEEDLTEGYQRLGDFVVIKVDDTGVGMTDDIKKRIFEPFFTTKPEGFGTGLGMAVAFGIVKQHEGFIEVKSSPGRGSTFEVFLPLTESELASQEASDRQESAKGGSETILLVEDNIHVRDLARLILEGSGYKVIEALDGIDAIEVFRNNLDAIDLVVMDVVMPRLGGKEVMLEMRKMRRNIQILFTSGYASGAIHTNFILEEGLEFIPKPYGADTLRGRVREMLDQYKRKRKLTRLRF